MSENRIKWLTAQIAVARDMADGLPADWLQEREEMRQRAGDLTEDLEIERAALQPAAITFAIPSLVLPPDAEPVEPSVEPEPPAVDAPEMGDAELVARLLASSAACCAAATAASASAAATRAAAGVASGTAADAIGQFAAVFLDEQARRLRETGLRSFAHAMLVAVTTPEQRAAMAAQDEAEDDTRPTDSTSVAGQGVNAQSTSDLEREG